MKKEGFVNIKRRVFKRDQKNRRIDKRDLENQRKGIIQKYHLPRYIQKLEPRLEADTDMTFDTLTVLVVRQGVRLRPTQELPFIEQQDY